MKLTAQELRRQLSYNQETGEFRWKVANNCHHAGSKAGGLTVQGYLRIGVNGKRYLAHHLAWLYVTGKWAEADVDHINLDRADNRFTNLRACSRSQNQANHKCHSNNMSGFKGVFRDKRNNKRQWIALIRVNYKRIWLGNFATPEEAHAAYELAAKQHFGEFARPQ